MKLEDLLNTCATSTPEDWNAIACWGARSGPSYLNQFLPALASRDDESMEFRLQTREHSHRAAYRPDLAISIGFGLDPDSTFPDESRTLDPTFFSEAFPDTSWSAALCDFFFCGNLVERKYYAVIDGGRAVLPLPDADRTVSQWEHDWFRVLDALGGYVPDYDSYFARSGITIR